MCGRSINNSVVGIIGCGKIGTSIAEKLKVFRPAQILYTSRNEKPVGKSNFANVWKMENQSDLCSIS